MSNDELLTDDYVADLLAKDAQDCSLKYSTMGMEAYGSNKKPTNLPKPNTRFLRNIIKDTNSHNAALLAKEASESQARLERLERAEGRRNAKPGDIRKRQIGSINAILGNKPSRGSSGEASSSEKRPHRDAGRHSRHRSRSPRADREWERHRDRRDEERSKRRSDGGHTSHTRKRQRRDDSPEEDHHRSRRGSSRRRSRSPSNLERRHRDRSTSRHRHSRSHRNSDRRRDERRKENAKPTNANDGHNSASDSDPLDDFIGPAPPPKSPVRTRGRGTISAFSGIDRRFAADYDPKLDVEADAEMDEWSDAVEAFRDRQKLRAAQEERMKAAGFTEEDLGRWKDSRREKTEADVKWSKAGEKREWDIGKEVGAD